MEDNDKYTIYRRPEDTGLKVFLEDVFPSFDAYGRTFLWFQYTEMVLSENGSRRKVKYKAEEYAKQYPNDDIEIYEVKSYKGRKDRFWFPQLIWKNGEWI